MDFRPHRSLAVWQQSMLLAKTVYEITADFPRVENYGLAMQMRRAATSIPSNIAEGAGRRGRKEFLNFINIAQGSASELDTQIELSSLIGYLYKQKAQNLTQKLTDVTKMLYGLSRAISK